MRDTEKRRERKCQSGCKIDKRILKKNGIWRKTLK